MDDPTIATYDRIASTFAERTFDTISPELAERRAAFARAIVERAPPNRFRILDAGCGPGRDSKWFHEQGFQVIGVDLSEGMLAEARRRVPGVDFQRADLRHLDFPPSSFDGIWCCAALLHLSRSEVPDVLASFRRLLGHGYLGLTVKLGEGEEITDGTDGPGTPRRITYFGRYELELYLERAGFEVRAVAVEQMGTQDPQHPWLGILAQTTLFTPLAGVVAVVMDGDHVLFSERADGRGWNLPAGFIDADEAPDEAVIREVREETGLEIAIDRLVGIYARPRTYRGQPRGLITHAFLCFPTGGTLVPTTEALQHVWLPPATPPTPMSSRHHLEILADALAARTTASAVTLMRRLH